MEKKVIEIKIRFSECEVIEVVEIDGVEKDEMVFRNFNDMIDFLPEYLEDFYNGAYYTLREVK